MKDPASMARAIVIGKLTPILKPHSDSPSIPLNLRKKPLSHKPDEQDGDCQWPRLSLYEHTNTLADVPRSDIGMSSPTRRIFPSIAKLGPSSSSKSSRPITLPSISSWAHHTTPFSILDVNTSSPYMGTANTNPRPRLRKPTTLYDLPPFSPLDARKRGSTSSFI